MAWLARAKRRVARELGSEAMAADAFQTTACRWPSLGALNPLASKQHLTSRSVPLSAFKVKLGVTSGGLRGVPERDTDTSQELANAEGFGDAVSAFSNQIQIPLVLRLKGNNRHAASTLPVYDHANGWPMTSGQRLVKASKTRSSALRRSTDP